MWPKPTNDKRQWREECRNGPYQSGDDMYRTPNKIPLNLLTEETMASYLIVTTLVAVTSVSVLIASMKYWKRPFIATDGTVFLVINAV